MFVRKPLPETRALAEAELEHTWRQYRTRLDLYSMVAVECGADSEAAKLTYAWAAASWETATWLAGWIEVNDSPVWGYQTAA